MCKHAFHAEIPLIHNFLPLFGPRTGKTKCTIIQFKYFRSPSERCICTDVRLNSRMFHVVLLKLKSTSLAPVSNHLESSAWNVSSVLWETVLKHLWNGDHLRLVCTITETPSCSWLDITQKGATGTCF